MLIRSYSESAEALDLKSGFADSWSSSLSPEDWVTYQSSWILIIVLPQMEPYQLGQHVCHFSLLICDMGVFMRLPLKPFPTLKS